MTTYTIRQYNASETRDVNLNGPMNYAQARFIADDLAASETDEWHYELVPASNDGSTPTYLLTCNCAHH